MRAQLVACRTMMRKAEGPALVAPPNRLKDLISKVCLVGGWGGDRGFMLHTPPPPPSA